MDDERSFKEKTAGKIIHGVDDAGRQTVGLHVAPPGRVIERRRRCQNCQWYDTDEHFDAHVQACLARDGRILRQQGASDRVIAAQAAKIRSSILKKRGQVGYCLRRVIRTDENAGADFTSAGYLCDQWSGAHGLRFGAEDGPIDKLPGELYDDRGESIPPPPDAAEPAEPAEPVDPEGEK